VHHLNELLPLYYKVRGWDENGVPTPAKLAELGLLRHEVEVELFATLRLKLPKPTTSWICQKGPP